MTHAAPPWRDPRVLLAVILAGAFALRVAYAIWLDGRPISGDALYYHYQGRFLADGRGFVLPRDVTRLDVTYETAFHPPLYGMYLAVISFFGGETTLWHRLASCVLGTGTVLVIAGIGRELGGVRVALVGAAIAAVYPPLFISDAVLMSESLFQLTIALGVWCAYRHLRSPNLGWAIAMSAAVTAAALTRTEAVVLYLLLVAPIVLVARGIPIGRRLTQLGAAALVAVVLLAPWNIFNLTRFERPFLISTSGPSVFAVANCDQTYGGSLFGSWSIACGTAVDVPADADESEGAQIYQREGLHYVREHLGRVPVVVAARVGRTFEVFRPGQNLTIQADVQGRGRIASQVGQWMLWTLLLVGGYGAWRLRRRPLALLPVAAILLEVLLTSATGYGDVRFRVPLDVVLPPVAAVGALGLFDRDRRVASRGGEVVVP